MPELTSTILLGSVGNRGVVDFSTVTFGMAARAFALLSNQVVKTTIKPATTMPMPAATTKPKMPAAIAPREMSAGSCVEVLRVLVRPWLAAEMSSRVLSAGRAKAKRLPILLMTSGQSTHCHPPKGPVRAGSEK